MARDDQERRAFGEAIATLRKRRGLTQRELAAVVGVSERAVQSWEQGYTHPYRHLRALEDVLGSMSMDLVATPFSLDEMTSVLEDREELPRRTERNPGRLARLEARLAEVERRLAQLEKPSAKAGREKT